MENNIQPKINEDNNQIKENIQEDDSQVVKTEKPNLKDEKSVKIKYKLNYNQALSVLKHFYYKTRGVKTTVYTILLVAISVYFFVTYLTMEKYSNHLFVTLLCIAVLITLWIMPYLSQKRTAKGYEQIETPFTMTFYETYLSVGEEFEEKFFEYEKIECEYLTQKDILCVSIIGESCFGVPLEYVNSSIEKDFILKTLKENIQDKFKEK